MDVFRRWKLRGQRLVDSLIGVREAKIYVEEILFSGGQKIQLNEGSILVVVGPNNAGKSSVLREIRDRLKEGTGYGPVLTRIEGRVKGTAQAFKKQVMDAGLPTDKPGVVQIGYYEYPVSSVDDEIKRGFIGSKIVPLFVSYLGAGERLKITEPVSRREYSRITPELPMQWLELDDGAERRISDLFEKSFDVPLVLNTLAGENLMLHIVPKGFPVPQIESSREQAKWFASLPKLHLQGDGMRSFAGTLMSLLVHPTSTVLLDEPEAFLHPPQARRLAEVIASEVPGECQVIIATHNDSFVRALLDASGERVVLARIVRKDFVNDVTVLDQIQLAQMWSDPLLKTSDVLSALFHEAAILCEGDSDARFFGSLLDATRTEIRDPDVRFYHFGGKDRLANIAGALRLIHIPVVVIVDIDILSDREKLLRLYEAMGGQRSTIEKDVEQLIRQVTERKGQLNGSELAVELRRVASDVDGVQDVPKRVKASIAELSRAPSNWDRVKHDGLRALQFQAFERVSTACQAVGLLINPEGELEGFCRAIPRTRKSEWLAQVIKRDLANDPLLAEARDFATKVRAVTRETILKS
jgi:ABC-type transporter Mla maintaining outer membrane lipid asymmetry ATPase subunit MlaF